MTERIVTIFDKLCVALAFWVSVLAIVVILLPYLAVVWCIDAVWVDDHDDFA